MSETTPAELLAAVQQFLRNELLPELEGFKAYNTRVAVNSLKIVARQIEKQSELEQVDKEIADFFQLESHDDVAQQLSVKLKTGELAFDDRLMQFLKRRTLIKLAIDNPKYSGYQQAAQRWSAPDALNKNT